MAKHKELGVLVIAIFLMIVGGVLTLDFFLGDGTTSLSSQYLPAVPDFDDAAIARLGAVLIAIGLLMVHEA